MDRREFLKSALIVPAVAGTAHVASSASAAGEVLSHETMSLAYWSADQAWMIAADPRARPARDVSPFLGLPGRRFANTLAKLGLLSSSGSDAAPPVPSGLIAPADFASGDTSQLVASTLAGVLINRALSASDIAAWLTETSVKYIWADHLRPSGWHPLPIGVLRPTRTALRLTDVETMRRAASGLTRTVLSQTRATAPPQSLFQCELTDITLVGADAAACIAAHGEAGTPMQPRKWREFETAGVTATGPVIAAFFDREWWHAQPDSDRRAIELAANATLHWHLMQQHMAAHMVRHSQFTLADSAPMTSEDRALVTDLRTCADACMAAIADDPAAQAVIGTLIELGYAPQTRYPSA